MRRSNLLDSKNAGLWNEFWKGKGASSVNEQLAARFIWDAPIETREQLGYRISQRYWDRVFAITHGTNTLECGCGRATVSTYLVRKGYEATMLDFSEDALKLAQAGFQNFDLQGRFIQGDVTHLPFRDGTFDIVMAFGLLMHLENIRPPIYEMVRVLKPGGIFAASIVTDRFSIQTVANVWNRVARFVYQLANPQAYKTSPNSRPFVNSFPLRYYQSIMLDAGLQDVRITGAVPFPVLSLPKRAQRGYVKLMQSMERFWLWFDHSDSKLTELLGWGWFAHGVKRG